SLEAAQWRLEGWRLWRGHGPGEHGCWGHVTIDPHAPGADAKTFTAPACFYHGAEPPVFGLPGAHRGVGRPGRRGESGPGPAPSADLKTRLAKADDAQFEQLLSESLRDVWAAILGNNASGERPGENENFFDLGGDSIKALQIISKMRAMGLDLNVIEIFD